MRKILLVGSLFVVVLLSGCIDGGDYGGTLDDRFAEYQTQWVITNSNPDLFTEAMLDTERKWPMTFIIGIEELNLTGNYKLNIINEVGEEIVHDLTGLPRFSYRFQLVWGIDHYVSLLKWDQTNYVSIGLIEIIFTGEYR